jgi:hypothetical protein
MDHGNFQGLFSREVGEEPRQALRQHRLAGARRPDYQEMVGAGGRDLQRLAAESLALHVSQIGHARRGTRRERLRCVAPHDPAFEGADHLLQVGGSPHLQPADQESLACTFGRHDHSARRARAWAPGCREGPRSWRNAGNLLAKGPYEGQNTWNLPKRAVEPELSDERDIGEGLGVQLPRSCQQADRHGQVEPGASLSEARRRQIYRDPLLRPPEPARDERGADAVARLPAGCVRQSYDVEAG